MAAMDDHGYDLQWKNHRSDVLLNLQALHERDAFTDVNIYCDGEVFRAHKVLLAACSTFFERVLSRLPPAQSQGIVLLETRPHLVDLVLRFMYHGEIFVDADIFNEFMTAAEKLEVRGLRKGDAGKDRSNGQSLNPKPELTRRKRVTNLTMPPVAPVSGPSAEFARGDGSDPLASAPKRARSLADTKVNGSTSSLTSFRKPGPLSRQVASLLKDETEELSSDGVGAPFGHVKPELQDAESNEDSAGEFYGTGDWNEEAGEEGYEEGAGGVEEPRQIPPEISPNFQITKWRPGTLIWTGRNEVGSPLFFCGECGYCSSNSSNVKTHVLRHTGETPFVCNLCSRGFKYKRSWRLHLTNIHGVTTGY